MRGSSLFFKLRCYPFSLSTLKYVWPIETQTVFLSIALLVWCTANNSNRITNVSKMILRFRSLKLWPHCPCDTIPPNITLSNISECSAQTLLIDQKTIWQILSVWLCFSIAIFSEEYSADIVLLTLHRKNRNAP